MLNKISLLVLFSLSYCSLKGKSNSGLCHENDKVAFNKIINQFLNLSCTENQVDKLRCSSHSYLETPIVETTSGYVRGSTVEVLNCSVNQFLNIPYAERPIGELRFSKPLAITTPRNVEIDGTRTGMACFQNINKKLAKHLQSEDCLYLNVWSPLKEEGELKPVMFWIHGGALFFGSMIEPIHNGSALAANGVVVVTINYRLGQFGWLYGEDESAPGNVGLYDQLLALQWVKNNIQSFGGDPNQVTVFAFSAGSWSVSALILSPLSRGLFKRVIMQSGAALQNKRTPVLTKTLALNMAKEMANHFNCSNDKQWLQCLRGIDAKLLNTHQKLTPYFIYETDILPLKAQDALKLPSLNLPDIDLMVGTVKDEGSYFAKNYYPKSEDLHSVEDFKELVESVGSWVTLPFKSLNSEKITEFFLKNVDTNSSDALKKAFSSFYGDLRVTCSTYFFAKLFAEQLPKRKVYFYYWTHASDRFPSGCSQDMGVCHGAEIEYVFGEPVLKNMSDKNFSEYAMKLWTNFAKYGNPIEDFPDDSVWPNLLNSDGVTKAKEINPFRPNHIIDDLFANTCETFWKNYFN